MREDGCSCVLAPNELQLAGYSLCLRPTREPSRFYGNHYYTASFFANPLEVIGPHLLEDAGFFLCSRRLSKFTEGSPLSPSEVQ